MVRQNHLIPSKPFDTGWYLFFAYVIRLLNELSARYIMIMSSLYHQIKNLLLINKSALWHSVLIIRILFIWFLAGRFGVTMFSNLMALNPYGIWLTISYTWMLNSLLAFLRFSLRYCIDLFGRSWKSLKSSSSWICVSFIYNFKFGG